LLDSNAFEFYNLLTSVKQTMPSCETNLPVIIIIGSEKRVRTAF